MSAREFCIPVKTDSPDFKKLVEEIEKINERYSDDIGPICGLFAALKTKTDLTFTPKLFGVPAESKNLRQGEELIFVWGERSYVDSIYHKFKGFEVGSGLDDLLNGFVDEEHQFKNGSAQNEHFFYSEISDNKMVVPFSVQSLQQDISMDENQDKVVINELKSFDKQVDDVLRGADTTSSHLEVLKVTPPLLRMVGVPNLPILMTAKHVKTITQESGSDSANYHGLGIDLIKKLPELISDPVMIMDSISPYEKARKSIVVVTQTVDKENRPIIGAIKIAGFGNDSNGFEISANILTSAYGKDSFKTFIERNISQGAVLYADKAKSQALFKTPGLQLPDNFNSLDFDIIIRKTNAFVNRDEQKSSEKSKRSPLLINLFAGPSAGKTTAALELTAALKKKGFNVEYVSEYAKELVLENKTELLKNQVHVTDEQFHRLDRLRNSGVEIIVTDSPVLLGKVYGEGKISREYGEKLLTYHNSFDNFNLFVNRGSTFQTEGRVHNLEQSKELDAKILAMLQDNRIFYGNYNHDEIDKTVERITTTFSRLNKLEETTEKNEGSMTADTNNANAQSARERVLKVRDDMVKTLLAHIEKNPTDWQSGWNNIAAGAPYNGKTSTAYRGLNALYLAFLGAERGYKDTRWVTFNQAKELGASVKKGEKSAPVIFFEFYDRKTKKAFDNRTVKDMTEEEKTAYLKENVYAVMKYSSVFNAEQCHNFPERKEIAMSEEEMANQNAKIETIIANSSAPVRYDGGSRAYYSPGTDSIHLPAIAAFDTMQDYYATALHEIAHSTGHESRLNRDLAGGFGSESYAKEELRAELACVFMQMEQGIQLNGKHITNHAAYLNSWLQAAKSDTSVFFKAAADAQKIADYVADNYLQAADSAVIKEENVAQEQSEEQPERNPMADYLRAEQLNRSVVNNAGEHAWWQENIRDWYTSAYPNDEAGLDIHPNATFKDLRDEVNRPNPISVYGMLGEDSVVRERTFTRLAELSGSSYASIYSAFLGETAQQKLENARALAKRLATETGEPYVTIEWSEHQALNSYDVMSLSEADKKLAALDAEGSEKGFGYDKTKLHIDYVFEGEHNSYECCRFDIGTEGGGLVHHIDEFLKYDTFLDAEERQQAENALKYFKVHMDLSAMVDTAIASNLPLQEQFDVQSYILAARGAVNSAVPFSTYKLPETSAFEQEDNTEHQFLDKTRYGSPINGIAEHPVGSGKFVAIIDNSEQKEDAFPDQYPPSFIIAHDYNPQNGEWQTGAFGFSRYEEARDYLIENYGFDIGQGLEAERSEEDYITQAQNEIAEFDGERQATDGNQRFYYPINEEAARRAQEANSYSDYKEGSATAEYRRNVDRAIDIATKQKTLVDPMYHERIDALLDTYAKRLAANINEGNAIDARMPSYLITGGGNFNVGKKQKQNAARDRNHQEWQEIQSILDRIRSTGKGGISSDDPNSIQKLTAKLEGLEKAQETMKAVNTYYRKNKTLDGCPELTAEQIAELKADMKRFPHLEGKPYPTWALSNNNAEIRRVKERIEELSKRQEGGFVGWEFNGGEVRANTADNRLQIFFEEKPDEETRSDLKHNGFKWSPKANAWQRQLTENAYYAADRINAIHPLSGEKPTALQRAYVRQHNAEVAGNAVQSNAGEQRVGDHEEKITLKQARNAMLDAQEQRQNHYAVRIEDVPYTDPEDGYEGTEPAQVIYIISEHGNVREWKTIPLDSDVFSSDLPNGSLVSYEPIEYEELEEIAEKVKEPIQTYKDVLRAELEVDTERHRSEAYYDQRVDDILNEHYRTEYGLFERNIENPKYLSGMLYAEENFRGERVVSLTQNESGKNIAIIAQANGRYAVAEDYHTDDGRNWGKYHLFDNQESAEEFRTKNFPSIAERANRYQALAASKSPLGQEYARIKGENADSVVFYRVGDFYEVLGTDAERVAEKLELTLTGRTIGTEERVPMCGVPYHAIDQYADTLVKKGENVIIADGTDIREHKAKINITEKRLRDYADTLRRNDLEVGNTAQTDEYYLSQAREQIAAYERSDEYRQALREDFPTDFIDDTPQDMAEITQNKPVEAQERKREWLSIELPNGAVGGQYGENTMIKMPKGEFSYYAFYVPTRFLKEADGKTQLRVASDYTFRLNNDGRQVELTGQELKDSFAGKHLDKTYKRVAPSRKFAQGLANIEKNVPAELKAIPTWCCYRTQWNEEKGKKDKFIISPIDGKWTSSKDPRRWVTFDAALKYARENNCEGLSVLLDKQHGITCIDLDKCILNADTGEMKQRATKLVEALSGTYIERSTSGNGLHIFVKDDILKNGTYNSQSMVKDDDPRGDLEVFDDKRIMSLTGDMYSKGNTLTRAGSAATVYLRQELGERRSIASNGNKPQPTASQSLSDNELIRWIRGSKQGAKFDDLYSGRGVSGDRSNDDGKLAHLLLYFNGGDKEQAFRIMRESGAYRPDKPDSYYRHTIDKMNDKIEVYAKRPTFSADGHGKPKGKGPGNGRRGNQA